MDKSKSVVNINDIHNAINAAEKFQELMDGLLPTLLIGVESFIKQSRNPKISVIKNESHHVLNGALVVHLFSMWDTYFDKTYINKYFRPEEKVRFLAFKHLRIVAAHNLDGSRKSNQKDKKGKPLDRMRHAEELDEIMSSSQPIKGLVIKKYKINLSQSDAALECRQFMQDMAVKLAAGRISVGGPYGKVRCTGGGTTEVM